MDSFQNIVLCSLISRLLYPSGKNLDQPSLIITIENNKVLITRRKLRPWSQNIKHILNLLRLLVMSVLNQHIIEVKETVNVKHTDLLNKQANS